MTDPDDIVYVGQLSVDPREEGALLLIGENSVLPLSAAIIDPDHANFALMVLMNALVDWCVTQRNRGHYPNDAIQALGDAGCTIGRIAIAEMEAEDQ